MTSQITNYVYELTQVRFLCQNKLSNYETEIKLQPMASLGTKFIKQVACGNSHVLLLTRAGTLYTQGIGRHGVLGHGDEEDIEEPKLVYDIIATNIYATSSTSMALCKVHGEPVENSQVKITYERYKDDTSSDKLEDDEAIVQEDQDLLYVWGYGEEGCLGLGKKCDALEPLLMPFSLTHFVTQLD